MTVPCLTQTKFLQLIEANGWQVVSNDYWERYDRLILEKNATLFVFQLKPKYFYLEVVKICHLLKISPPVDHIHSYYLHKKMYDVDCYCGEPKPFKECHGKASLGNM